MVEATEEHRPAHFHVAVFGARYLPYVASMTHRRAAAVVASADEDTR